MINRWLPIKIKHLKDKQIFPFNIFFKDEEDNFVLILKANTILDDIPSTSLYISQNQKMTFLKYLKLSDSQVWPNNECLEIEECIEHKEELHITSVIGERASENKLDKNVHIANNTPIEEINRISQALENNNFLPLIFQVRKDILMWPGNYSRCVSQVKELAKRLMLKNSYSNRLTALTYFLARIQGTTIIDELAPLLLASFSANIGFSQININWLLTPERDYDEEHLKRFKKHVGLSVYLLSKAQLDVNALSKTIVLDHHETFDGKGYPSGKHHHALEPMANYIFHTELILKICEGKWDGEKRDLFTALNVMIENKSIPYHNQLNKDWLKSLRNYLNYKSEIFDIEKQVS
ncbi:MAG: HD domain-containing phosphohydrolase [Bacteriovoracia bacterium]